MIPQFISMIALSVASAARLPKTYIVGRQTENNIFCESLADRLFEWDDKNGDDAELWIILGGAVGVCRVGCAAWALGYSAIKMARQNPSITKRFSRKMVTICLYLWLITWACLFEAAILHWLPFVPRIQAQGCAHLYCDVMLSREALLEFSFDGANG